MITLEKKEDIAPICPHCKAELARIWLRELKGFLGKNISTSALSVELVSAFPTEKDSGWDRVFA